MFLVGSFPCTKAGKATDAEIDLRLRGGIVMIRRVIRPSLTCSKCQAMACICQLSRYSALGLRVMKTFRMKLYKLPRNMASSRAVTMTSSPQVDQGRLTTVCRTDFVILDRSKLRQERFRTLRRIQIARHLLHSVLSEEMQRSILDPPRAGLLD